MWGLKWFQYYAIDNAKIQQEVFTSKITDWLFFFRQKAKTQVYFSVFLHKHRTSTAFLRNWTQRERAYNPLVKIFFTTTTTVTTTERICTAHFSRERQKGSRVLTFTAFAVCQPPFQRKDDISPVWRKRENVCSPFLPTISSF